MCLLYNFLQYFFTIMNRNTWDKHIMIIIHIIIIIAPVCVLGNIFLNDKHTATTLSAAIPTISHDDIR